MYVRGQGEDLTSSRGQTSLRRFVEGCSPKGIVFITLDDATPSPQLLLYQGRVELVHRMEALLAEKTVDISAVVASSGDLLVSANGLLPGLHPEVIELRLPGGLVQESYCQIGIGLNELREEGILVICLDRAMPESGTPGQSQWQDLQIRQLLGRWEDEYQWIKALARGGQLENTGADNCPSLSDTTVCMLNTAFGLGGLKAPQRIFQTALNDRGRSVFGYGWMH
ncbi:hypothetical protein SAMN04487963_3644 [Marinobacter zhejiangensis]|uniref:Uncharacterized protein n=2 Tax=Marinobacter zhejiangensis TaxID=488535 RepID=A0A1I4TL57_9GAMM|nr:hypothetical protein SAMN04487963_3644 [Marinobacter zhejiangensis]